MSQVTTNPKAATKPVKPTAQFAVRHSQITEALNIAEFGAGQAVAQRGVLIETSRNRITLNTFDFWTAVSVSIPVGTAAVRGHSLLDFAELKKALAAMVAGETKKTAASTMVSLAGDLLATEHITVPITTLDTNEFAHPPKAVPAIVTVDAQAFLAQLARVLPAAGQDITLPALTGVQMALNGETLTMAATDRYRFAVAEVTTQPAMSDEKELTTLIPAGILAALAKRLKAYDGPVGIGITQNADDVAWTTLSMGDTTITIRPLEGELPKYKSLFPTGRDVSVQADRATLVRGAKKCQALIKAKGETGSPVAFAWDDDGTLTLAPRIGTEDDHARTKGMTAPAAITHGSVDTLRGNRLSLNAAFLLDALGTFTGDTITLHIRGMADGQTTKPVLLTDGSDMAGEGYRHLLMPVRLGRSK
ncbi:DNA polymerase III subunit beta [Streptomyces sp. NBC_01361]|uniref:DNA polymerase III subunit beta n=1 Tax=Streptomyces sp. NBC_01361 TaxID=2903838 RepID=UPI002E325B11|nr:DNA polymerase III subunit beta [Streptomyces sp. NBC_01361]